MTTTKARYRVPTRTVDARVSLDEFDCSEMADYLRTQGYYVSSSSAAPHDQDPDPDNVLNPDDLDHIETLALCGQIDAARSEALYLVGNAIGRVLQ